jgi:DNA-binding transcriptional regulator YiaG
MIEKKYKRPRKPRAYPHHPWADREQFVIERKTAGLTKADAAAYLGVSLRTLRNWENGSNRILYPAFKLIRMRAKAIVHVPGWDGWRFARDGALVTPTGRAFQPWELQNLELVVSLSRRYLELQRQVPQRQIAQVLPLRRAS